MLSPNDIALIIKNKIQPSQCHVHEFSGGSDHFHAFVVSPCFDGLSPLARHRLLMDLFKTHIDSGTVHALSLKTYTPAEWEQQQSQFPGVQLS